MNRRSFLGLSSAALAAPLVPASAASVAPVNVLALLTVTGWTWRNGRMHLRARGPVSLINSFELDGDLYPWGIAFAIYRIDTDLTNGVSIEAVSRDLFPPLGYVGNEPVEATGFGLGMLPPITEPFR